MVGVVVTNVGVVTHQEREEECTSGEEMPHIMVVIETKPVTGLILISRLCRRQLQHTNKYEKPFPLSETTPTF